MFGNYSFKIISTLGGVGIIIYINYVIYKSTLQHKLIQTSPQTSPQTKVVTNHQSIQCERNISDISDSGELEIIEPTPSTKYRWFFLNLVGRI